MLGDAALSKQYYAECMQMAQRINAMRKLLVEQLYTEGSAHDWSPVQAQIGMFAFTGMSGDMVGQLTAQYNIFLTKDGRISLAGVTPGNVAYIAKAMHTVSHGKKIVLPPPSPMVKATEPTKEPPPCQLSG